MKPKILDYSPIIDFQYDVESFSRIYVNNFNKIRMLFWRMKTEETEIMSVESESKSRMSREFKWKTELEVSWV